MSDKPGAGVPTPRPFIFPDDYNDVELAAAIAAFINTHVVCDRFAKHFNVQEARRAFLDDQIMRVERCMVLCPDRSEWGRNVRLLALRTMPMTTRPDRYLRALYDAKVMLHGDIIDHVRDCPYCVEVSYPRAHSAPEGRR
jgi:hypothetical protein